MYNHNIDMEKPVLFWGKPKRIYRDDYDLWIIPETGVVCILEQWESAVMDGLSSGISPLEAISSTLESFDKWLDYQNMLKDLDKFFKKILVSGFVHGFCGRHREDDSFMPQKRARIHLTHACQLRCVHCYMESSPNIDRSNELTLDDWKSFLKEFRSSGGEELLFSGGEPLLWDGCIELFEFAKSIGFKIQVLTNGLLIPIYSDRLKKCVDRIQISLGSPRKHSNDLIRGNGTFDKIIHVLNVIKDDGFIESGIEIAINISTMEHNIQDVLEAAELFIQEWEGFGFKTTIGPGLIPLGRSKTGKGHFRHKGDPQWEDLRNLLGKLDPVEKVGKTVKRNSCGYCHKLVIGPTGDVFPCHLMSHSIGKIWDKSLSEWYKDLRKHSEKSTVECVDGCRECDVRHVCGGSCLVLNKEYEGTMLKTYCNKDTRDDVVNRIYKQLVCSI